MRQDLEVPAAQVVLAQVVLDLVVLGLVARVVLVVPVLVVPGLVARVDPEDRVARVAQVDRVGLMGPAALEDRVVRVVPVDLVVLDRMDPADRVGLMGLVVPAAPDRMVPVDLVVLDRMVLVDLVDPVVLERMDPADLAGRMAPVARLVPTDLLARADPVAPMAPAVRSTVDLVVPVDRSTVDRSTVERSTVDRAVPVDRHRRHMCNAATTTAAARSGVVRGTHRTASAPRVTVHPRLRPRTDSGGMMGLLPERRRPTGMVRRLPVVGTDRLLPEAGTNTGTDRPTTSVGGRQTMARSTTTGTTPHRSSTRCSAAGVSGSSVPGSRCTDLSRA